MKLVHFFTTILAISAPAIAYGEETYQVFEGTDQCPTGMQYATLSDATDDNTQICTLLGKWDIARLKDGASMDGPGYGCGYRPNDTRGMGTSICKKVATKNSVPKPSESTGSYNLNWSSKPEYLIKEGDAWTVAFSVTVQDPTDNPEDYGGGGSQLPYKKLSGSIDFIVDGKKVASINLDEVNAASSGSITVSGGMHTAYLVYRFTNGSLADVSDTLSFDAQ